jgi:HAMP domain-containing protein
MLIVLAFLINLTFTQFSLIKRLRRLTVSVKTIAEGELETELRYTDPGKSKDEVDHVSHAIDLLRNSLRVAIRCLNRAS